MDSLITIARHKIQINERGYRSFFKVERRLNPYVLISLDRREFMCIKFETKQNFIDFKIRIKRLAPKEYEEMRSMSRKRFRALLKKVYRGEVDERFSIDSSLYRNHMSRMTEELQNLNDK